ncbi:lytic polysaccharide monooxygenase auxiliary activity family 9 protein [Cellulomonas timonensis]|uniref:lytic polysaccharide monooxygenase auxiliary activity family 9 protein n=1 Tax=Cellulomonas timonensis TaxID=1689271 RepID=UPI00082A1627|nr:lytic polysaccharide monooxygenase [Cellulomonas timonensis]
MSIRAHLRKIALALPLAVVAAALTTSLVAAPASAHGSVTDPPSRNWGCLDRWGDRHQAPEMAQQDPMCWAAFQDNPAAMWNWNGLFREGVAGRHEQVIPNGQLCSGGLTEGGRYRSMDTPGNWTAKNVPTNFTLTLTDGAQHGADYLKVYITKPGFDPTTQSLGWGDLTLLKETGRYASAGQYQTDLNLSGRSGRAVIYTIWQASHLDQSYYICSDVNIGGTTTPTPTPTVSPTVTPTPTPTMTTPTPTPTPTTPPTGACAATVTVGNSWNGGYQAQVTVTAGASAITGWKVTVNGATITQAWNGTLSGGNTITNASWNGSLGAGASTTAGFLGTGSTNLTATCALA